MSPMYDFNPFGAMKKTFKTSKDGMLNECPLFDRSNKFCIDHSHFFCTRNAFSSYFEATRSICLLLESIDTLSRISYSVTLYTMCPSNIKIATWLRMSIPYMMIRTQVHG